MVTLKRKDDCESYSYLPHYPLLWSPGVKSAFEPSNPPGQCQSLVFCMERLGAFLPSVWDASPSQSYYENCKNNVPPTFFPWGLLSRLWKGLLSDRIWLSKNGTILWRNCNHTKNKNGSVESFHARNYIDGLYSDVGLISGIGFFVCVFLIVWAYFYNGLFSRRARGARTYGCSLVIYLY